MFPTDQTWLTTAEAADYARAGNPSTVRGWVAKGLLRPDGRVGMRGSWLFRRETLDEFLKRGLALLPSPTVDTATVAGQLPETDRLS